MFNKVMNKTKSIYSFFKVFKLKNFIDYFDKFKIKYTILTTTEHFQK